MKEFKKFTPPTVKIKMKRKIVFSNAKKLYDMLLNIYFDDYNNITDEEKEKLGEKCNSNNLFIKGQRCIGLKKEKKKVNHSQKKLLLKE